MTAGLAMQVRPNPLRVKLTRGGFFYWTCVDAGGQLFLGGLLTVESCSLKMGIFDFNHRQDAVFSSVDTFFTPVGGNNIRVKIACFEIGIHFQNLEYLIP